MLFEPAQFEALTDHPWDPAHVEHAIAAIVADADAAFDPETLWPAHEWDGWRAPLPMKNLYVGAAGVIWALDTLRRRGHAETSLDLAGAAARTLELERAEPDFMAGETHSHPAAVLRGETGPLLVAFRLAADAALADDLHALVRANVTNPTDDVRRASRKPWPVRRSASKRRRICRSTRRQHARTGSRHGSSCSPPRRN
jgi:hypothetical protein